MCPRCFGTLFIVWGSDVRLGVVVSSEAMLLFDPASWWVVILFSVSLGKLETWCDGAAFLLVVSALVVGDPCACIQTKGFRQSKYTSSGHVEERSRTTWSTSR